MKKPYIGQMVLYALAATGPKNPPTMVPAIIQALGADGTATLVVFLPSPKVEKEVQQGATAGQWTFQTANAATA
jgi:hypothetical protein